MTPAKTEDREEVNSGLVTFAVLSRRIAGLRYFFVAAFFLVAFFGAAFFLLFFFGAASPPLILLSGILSFPFCRDFAWSKIKEHDQSATANCIAVFFRGVNNFKRPLVT